MLTSHVSRIKYSISKAFTVTEMLIALAILGLIAAFTVPKVIGQIDLSIKKAIYKDVVKIVSGSYQAFLADQAPRQPSFVHSYWLMDYLTGLERLPNGTLLCHSLPQNNCFKYPSSNTVLWFGNGSCISPATKLAISFDIDGLGPEPNMNLYVDINGKVTNRYQTSEPSVVAYGGTTGCPGITISHPPMGGKPAWLE